MDLSPNDVRNYEFPNQMRGYDKEEVNNFKEQVAAALEAAKQENLKLSMELDSVKSQLTGLKQFEDTIKNAAIDARRNADLTITNAKQEAEMLLNKARAEAEKELQSLAKRAEEIENQITKLQLSKKSYYTKIRNLIQSHLELVDDLGQKETTQTVDEDRIEVTDSAEVESRRRETVATPPSKTGGIKTEEANAPEASDENLSDSGRQMLEAAIKGSGEEAPANPQETQAEAPAPPPEPPKPSETPGIDPELAAALENYQHAAKAQQDQQNETDASGQVTPPPAVVETDAKAEDVPEGFVSSNQEQLMQQAATDTGPVNKTESQAEAPKSAAPAAESSDGPNDIAKELDEVVAKFEEEMDKAAKG